MEICVDNFWLTGFVDGEGCFSISFNLRNKIKVGIETCPSFSISQKKDKYGINYNLICDFVKIFKGGFVRFSNIDQTWKYETRNICHIWDNVIPYFDNNPLRSAKKIDFKKFRDVCSLIKSNKHLSRDGIFEIIEIAFSMNFSGRRKYFKEFLLKSLEKVKI